VHNGCQGSLKLYSCNIKNTFKFCWNMCY